MLTAVILTLNEEKHLARCLASVQGVADSVLVVDCFSTDNTPAIARQHGVRVVQQTWVSHAARLFILVVR
jgi:glycosyltransferase involved in cell wall biosynthesis